MSTETTDTELISSISADKKRIADIFCDDYLFTIPNYQRPYSWELEHCVQLLDDLDSFAFKEDNFDELPPYFLGSAVIIKRENVKNAQIVDGQQRLTTLTILLSCLRYAIVNEDDKATLSELIFQKGNKLKGTSATYRLKTRVRDQDFFNKLIQEEKGLEVYELEPDKFLPKNDAQFQMLANAKELLKEFRKRNYSQEQLEHLATYIIQKCVLVIVASTDEEMAFRIFNVLNDRGKDLTIADILKSEVLEKIEEKNQDTYTDRWEECEVKLGVDNFKDFFSHLRTIFVKKKAEKAIIAEIRESVSPSKNPKTFIDDTLIPFTDAYLNVLKENYSSKEHAEEINRLLKRFKRFSHGDWIPSAIFFIAKNPLASDQVKKFLIQLEKLTLALEGMGASLNPRIERYALINAFIEEDKDLYSADSPLMLSKKDRESIISTLSGPDLYGRRMVKPVLAAIEEQMNDASITINYGDLSIEHILPQTPTEEYWVERFKADDIARYTDCLGNLTLITVRKNSQARNYEFSKKVEVYFRADGKASNLAMVNELSNGTNWDPYAIMYRKDMLLDHFLRALDLDPQYPKSK